MIPKDLLLSIGRAGGVEMALSGALHPVDGAGAANQPCALIS